MKLKILLIFVFLAFVLFTAYTMSISDQSLLSFGYQLISQPDTAQVVIDLYIMATLAIIWMYIDSKRVGKPIWYWALFTVLTLVFVSAGPLLYLVLRSNKERTNSEKG